MYGNKLYLGQTPHIMSCLLFIGKVKQLDNEAGITAYFSISASMSTSNFIHIDHSNITRALKLKLAITMMMSMYCNQLYYLLWLCRGVINLLQPSVMLIQCVSQ